jgi:hypothetical protein
MSLWRKQPVPSGPTDLAAAGETIRRLQARVLELELETVSNRVKSETKICCECGLTKVEKKRKR